MTTYSKVREQINRAVCSDWPNFQKVELAMAVVAPILAERDAAVERAEQAERSRDKLRASGKQHLTDMLMLTDHNIARAERAEADLAAARQQLDQVRALANEGPTVHKGVGMVKASDLHAILDVPARPADHDETGQ